MDLITLIPTMIISILIVGIYFLPSFIAYHRGHKDKLPLLIVNFFLGWSGIFWVLSLAWSLLYDSVLPQTDGAAPVKKGGFGKLIFILIILILLLLVANAYINTGALNDFALMPELSGIGVPTPSEQSGVPMDADAFLSGQ